MLKICSMLACIQLRMLGSKQVSVKRRLFDFAMRWDYQDMLNYSEVTMHLFNEGKSSSLQNYLESKQALLKNLVFMSKQWKEMQRRF